MIWGFQLVQFSSNSRASWWLSLDNNFSLLLFISKKTVILCIVFCCSFSFSVSVSVSVSFSNSPCCFLSSFPEQPQ